MASQLDLTRFYDVIIRISVFELGFLTREFQIIILIIIWSFFQKLMLRYTPIQRLTISQNDSLDIFVGSEYVLVNVFKNELPWTSNEHNLDWTNHNHEQDVIVVDIPTIKSVSIKTTLRKICQNMRFHWNIFSCIRTQSYTKSQILSLHGKIRIREKPYLDKPYAVKQTN